MSDRPNKFVHRELRAGMSGPDVRKVQEGLNRRASWRDLEFLRVVEDGVCGPVTIDHAAKLLYAMGLFGRPIIRVRRDEVLSFYCQRLLRGSRPRTAPMKALDQARRPRVRRWRLDQGPRIVRLGRAISNVFGPLGTFEATSGHYTAGPVPTSDAEGLALFRAYHEHHRRLGWGGLSYAFVVLPTGTIILGHEPMQKAAHVLNHNSGNVGVVVPGTTGDTANAAQQRTLRWLVANAHTSRMPSSHRLPKPIGQASIVLRPHQDWPDNFTGCPGDFRPFYESRGQRA